MSNEPVATPPPAVGEDKTVAILSYITIIGFIVAIVLNSSKKTALGAFHLRQVLGLIIAGFACGIAIMILSFILAFIPIVGAIVAMILYFGFWIGFLILLIMGFIGAIKGTMTPVPVVGAKFQEWFKGVFN